MKLLLDEMFAPEIARQLRKRGHDVIAAAELADFRALGDREIVGKATGEGRGLVSENVQDLLPIHMEMSAAGVTHAGLILTTHRRYPRTRRGVGSLVKALGGVLDQPGLELANRVYWL